MPAYVTDTAIHRLTVADLDGDGVNGLAFARSA
jgi:hypothetical protein